MKFSTWELVSDITDYQLEFITQKIQTTDPIWRTNIILKNIYLDEIQYTDVIAVADAKTRNAKIPQNFGLVKLQNLYGNFKSFFSTHFILKLLINIFQWFAVEIAKTRLLLGCKNKSHVFRSEIKFLEWNFRNIIQ